MTNKNRFIASSLSAMLLATLLIAGHVISAQTPITIDKKTPYYINANTAGREEVFKIQEGQLNVQYEDKHGTWKEINLQVFNWKYEKVGTFSMDKTFGLNHYTIDLQTRLSNLEMNQNYFCLMSDETGSKYEWMFRNIPPVRSQDLQTDILINPVNIDCGKLEGNLAEFHSEIKNGVAPFNVRWYVLDDRMNKLLYLPREETIELQKGGSMIRVDRAPGYYVVLDVTDACGTSSRKMVYLDCEKLKKKVNTIFVQPAWREGISKRKSN